MAWAKRLMLLAVCAGMLWMVVPAEAQTATTKSADKPAAALAAVPDETIAAMIELLRQPPKGDTPEEVAKHRVEVMQKVLAMGWETEKAHPDASNLAMVRRIMLSVSGQLLAQQKNDDARRQFNHVVEHILNSNAAPEVKAIADYLRTEFIVVHHDRELAAMLPGKQTAESADADANQLAAAALEAFVARHNDSPFAVQACILAARMARNAKLDGPLATYVKALKENHMDAPGVKDTLRSFGEYSDVGKSFEVTLTTLDGKTLTLPGDLKGKVVVIDFWATWCGPCVAAMPELKKFYAAHKDKGVEIIAVSLDDSKEAVENFLKDKGYDWIQTFDAGGGGHRPPNATESTPSPPCSWWTRTAPSSPTTPAENWKPS